MKNLLLFSIIITLSLLSNSQTVTDIDGNVYNTITIGTQVWMAENLKTTKFNDGTDLTYLSERLDTTPWYCWYDSAEVNFTTFGALYNWYAINTTTVSGKNVCPIGWHVPDDNEWTTLTNYLGGDNIAGGKMKEIGTTHWDSSNTGATNEIGFTALPGGARYCIPPSINFYQIGRCGYWWISSEEDGLSWFLRIDSEDIDVNRYRYDRYWSGYSVRCVKSNNVTINSNSPEELAVYPNPTNETLYLENIKNENFTLIIYDLNGTIVLRKHINSSFIDISKLTNGVYIIMLLDSESAMISKFIKE
jgi:uncharacterized protein (TIGR02145 family)